MQTNSEFRAGEKGGESHLLSWSRERRCRGLRLCSQEFMPICACLPMRTQVPRS